MGKLLYGSPAAEHAFDDRVLAHLQIVITNKFRRGEGFILSLDADATTGTGRRSVWLHPTIPIQYAFAGSRMPSINPAWLQQLTAEANSGRGLHVLPEPTHTPAVTSAVS